MKRTSYSGTKQAILNGALVYTHAEVYVPKKDDTTYDQFTLNPAKFRVEGNRYEHTSGDMFPIGMVLSKSITVIVDNTGGIYSDYDWKKAVIHLYSRVTLSLSSREDLDEGVFYVSDVKQNPYSLEITAYDLLSFLDSPANIQTYAPPSQFITTVWEYVEYICTTIIPGKLDLDDYSPNFLDSSTKTSLSNKNLSLVSIPGESDPTTTLRDVLGYLAQIMGANVVMSTILAGSELVDPPYCRIKFVPVDLDIGSIVIVTSDELGTIIEDVIEGGGFHQEAFNEDFNCRELSQDVYTVLNNFTDVFIYYDDINYTGIELTYPVTNRSKKYSVTSSIYNKKNSVKLYNPILQQDSTTVSTSLQHAVDQLYLYLCGSDVNTNIQYKLKQFKGSYANNPLLEFADPVIVLDEKGNAYTSIITSHLYNYLGGSDIRCSIPTEMQNDRTFFR